MLFVSSAMSSTRVESVAASISSKVYGKVLITLTNQLLPEEKLNLPTVSQIDGLDPDIEADLRIYGCELIQTAGMLLKLPQVAMATGQVLLQRFYYSKSFVRHPVEHTAMACICLASKIEEAPRRARDVINVFHHIRQMNANKTLQPVILDQNYIQLKNLVIKAERRVLKELGFCVHIKHPHKIIVMYLQVLGFEKNQKLMQYSWNYMNDALRTDVFVRYQPETVACACIYLTARKLQLPLPKSPAWYSIFGVTETNIRDICHRILKLYTRPKPNVELLERIIEELNKKYHEARNKARNNAVNSGMASGGPSGAPAASGTVSSSNTTADGAHNAWGGFISRSGSHVTATAAGSRSQSPSNSAAGRSSNRKSLFENGENHISAGTVDEDDVRSKRRRRSRSGSRRRHKSHRKSPHHRSKNHKRKRSRRTSSSRSHSRSRSPRSRTRSRSRSTTPHLSGRHKSRSSPKRKRSHTPIKKTSPNTNDSPKYNGSRERSIGSKHHGRKRDDGDKERSSSKYSRNRSRDRRR